MIIGPIRGGYLSFPVVPVLGEQKLQKHKFYTILTTRGSGYDVYMAVGNIPEVTWDGVTNTNYSNTYPYYINSQRVTINRAYTNTWNNDGALKSVVVHEMGHVFGLDDYGHNKTIMNGYTFGTNSRYGTYGLTVPQTDDINGVNAKY